MPPTELQSLQPEAHEFFPQGVQLRAHPDLALSNIQDKNWSPRKWNGFKLSANNWQHVFIHFWKLRLAWALDPPLKKKLHLALILL